MRDNTRPVLYAICSSLLLLVLCMHLLNNSQIFKMPPAKRITVTQDYKPNRRIVSTNLPLDDKYNRTEEISKATNQGKVPDVIGIGVRKCGTGVYMKFLEKHGYFRFPSFYNYETEYFTRNKHKGLSWYMSVFDPTPNEKLAIEKTPHYLYAKPSSIPDDILQLNSNAKIILLLCNPTPRAYSCFVHHYGKGISSKDWPFAFEHYVRKNLPLVQQTLANSPRQDIEKFIFANWNSNLECIIAGLYSFHIKRWQSRFNESHMMIINGEKVMQNPGPEYIKLQKFLGVPEMFQEKDWVKNNTTGHFCLRPPNNRSTLYCQDDQVKKGRTRSLIAAKPKRNITMWLNNFYRPYNDELVQLLGKKFLWN
ncbi:unnamed protein product [Clavelina lepadiformis]|uniref:Sulfotransferase n=1 Tax=Clavelina lepadiformis TaxID=159417 RepID=A0ABP0H1P4_CLALP